MPAQMPGAAGAARPVAQQEQRDLAAGSTQAETAAGGEIEQLRLPPHLGHQRRDRPAGDHFLGRPQQFGHIGRLHQHQPGRIDACPGQARPVRQALLLCVSRQRQVKNSRPAWTDQLPGLRQGKAQTGASNAQIVGKHFLDQPTRQHGKIVMFRPSRALHRFQQGRFALNIGNDIPQRGKALAATGELHDALPEQNKNI